MEKFFKLKENGTTVGREIVAGLTTFFAMAYIIVVNPNTLSGRAGGLEEELMPWGAVFLATIIASIIGTLVIAGCLAAKKKIATTAGTLSTTTAVFVFLLFVIVLLVGALSFFPALALGPIAEFFSFVV